MWIFYHPLSLTFLEVVLIHDYRYSNKDISKMDRLDADDEFYYNCKKKNKYLAFIFYIAVRTF